MAKKTSLGRQRIKIAKIEIPNHRQVTFSKRRSGLFKKACELCTLCGVEIVIIVFSPAQKVFSFGHPDVDTLVNKFLSRSHGSNSSGSRNTLEGSHSVGANVRELNTQLTQITNLLEEEKRHGESLNEMRAAQQNKCWWEAPIEKLEQQELEQLCLSLEQLKKNVNDQASKVLMETTSAIMVSNDGMGMVLNQSENKPFDMVGTSSSVLASCYNYTNGFGIF